MIQILFMVNLSFGAEVLTKGQALQSLKLHGYRWKQTETLSSEAVAKRDEAKSYKRLQLHFSAKEFFGKVNPLQYGLTIANDVNLIAVGTTGIEGALLLFDQAMSDRIDAAEKNELYAKAQAEHYQSELTSLMFAQYLNVQKLKRKLSDLEISKKRASDILRIAKDKVASGAGVKVDLMRAEALVAAEELKTGDAMMSYEKAKQELAVTLGRESLDQELEELNPTLIDSEQNQDSFFRDLEHRADLKSLRLGTEAMTMLSEAAAHERWPKVGIFGSWGVFNAGATPFGWGAPSTNGLGGLAISMPLYTGGRLGAKEQEEAARALKTELQESHLRLEARSQLKLSLDQLKTAKIAIEVTSRKVKIHEEELRLIQKKYQSGSGSGLEVTNSLVAAAEAQDAYVDAVVAYELAKVGLFKNSGKVGKLYE